MLRAPPMSRAAEVAERVVREGIAPLAAAGWAVAAVAPPEVGPSRAQVRDVGGAVDTLFDLASVTKPMTAVAVASAGLDPSTPIGALLPEARGTAGEDTPLELLLAHRAGLEAHRPFYEPLAPARAAARWTGFVPSRGRGRASHGRPGAGARWRLRAALQ